MFTTRLFSSPLRGGSIIALMCVSVAGLAQSVKQGRNEIFLGVRYTEPLSMNVRPSGVEQSQFQVQQKGVELGYYRRARNGNSWGVEVFAYVSRYGYSGKLANCSSLLEYRFPYTSEGNRKGVAAYDPLMITIHHRWNIPSGPRNEWRFSLGAGIMPFHSRSVSFTFSSSDVVWACPSTLTAQIGYGETIAPLVCATAAYHIRLFHGQGLLVQAAFVGTVFHHYSGYVAVDLLSPTEVLETWQRRYLSFSVAARYDIAW